MTLRDLLVRKKLPPEQALRLVPQLRDALEYAHSRGVIHRSSARRSRPSPERSFSRTR